jgi:hypothetical protein
MTMSTGAARSPWTDALVAAGSVAVVSTLAVVRDWDFDSWMLTANVFVVGGIVSAITQARRNRRADLAVKQARE